MGFPVNTDHGAVYTYMTTIFVQTSKIKFGRKTRGGAMEGDEKREGLWEVMRKGRGFGR